MNAIQPNVSFRFLGATFDVVAVYGRVVRFHRSDDVYDVWELSQEYLLEKLLEGKLNIVESD